MPAHVIEADLTWTGVSFEPGIRIVVDASGTISSVEHVGAADGPSAAPGESGAGSDGRGAGVSARDPVDGAANLRLAGRAILPGFVDVHSHAFQRGLRGRGETFPPGAPDTPGNFWSWRDAMYRLVDSMTADMVHALSLQAFHEMRAAGITTVGEFHYLHHDASGTGYAFDEIVLQAARDAGIRIVLLNAFYHTGGLGAGGHVPLAGGQLRFSTPAVDEYWRQFDRLAGRIDPATQTLGVVAHSVRAVPIGMIRELHQESVRRALPFHIHVEEQLREIEDCVAYYGRPPMALLHQHLAIDERVTAVHCTHTAAEDMRSFLSSGGNVCLCPLTEANLGDGIADVPWMLHGHDSVCIGTDSNARISMIEEMRQIEYVQRLALMRRGVCVDEEGRLARRLLDCGTANGARALGVSAGAIEAGRLADFVTIDLEAPALAGWQRETLAESILFGAGSEVIAGTCVHGVWSE